ncbi:MAG: 6,7-dimethyl-8-ribityllumazine synthase [Salaquimonas sp.]|nr:6,7-dimethyl-8-ribityllumazine synthase [Salaquimonas sp.]
MSPHLKQRNPSMSKAPHLLIVEARFYDDLADELLSGAVNALENAGATYDRVSVPGALEIPGAISMALAGAEEGGTDYDGFIALGCVIRGETSHYDIVAGESARGLMDLAVQEAVAVGNGILTCDNGEQAWARARVSEKNKGGGAAEAALAMITLRDRFGA